jgi:hypothetical protein
MKRAIAEYVALCDNCQRVTSRTFATLEDTRMEMGRNKYGFHCGIAKNKKWL